ncbi:hypothetical protein ACWGIB_27465 [Streptomyces xiamenensis]
MSKYQSVRDYEAAVDAGDAETAVRLTNEICERDDTSEVAELAAAAGITPLQRWW